MEYQILIPNLNLCTFKLPTLSTYMSDKGNSDHALEKCEGVKDVERNEVNPEVEGGICEMHSDIIKELWDDSYVSCSSPECKSESVTSSIKSRKQPWIHSLHQEDWIDIEINIYEWIGEYMENNILCMPDPSFHENMKSDITELVELQILESKLCEEKNIEDITSTIHQICDSFFETQFEIVPRSYKTTFAMETECAEGTKGKIEKTQEQVALLKTRPQPNRKPKNGLKCETIV